MEPTIEFLPNLPHKPICGGSFYQFVSDLLAILSYNLEKLEVTTLFYNPKLYFYVLLLQIPIVKHHD